jgi:hypothetical protein
MTISKYITLDKYNDVNLISYLLHFILKVDILFHILNFMIFRDGTQIFPTYEVFSRIQLFTMCISMRNEMI